MKVRDIMSQPVVTCRTRDSLNTAARLMWEHDCGTIPVVDDRDMLVGIVTDRDICMAAYTQGKSLRAIPVSLAMAKQVFHCYPDDSLDEAERLMAEKQIRRVPIVDNDDHPVGMLSVNDLTRLTASNGKRGQQERVVVQTLAAIGEPRRTMPPWMHPVTV